MTTDLQNWSNLLERAAAGEVVKITHNGVDLTISSMAGWKDGMSRVVDSAMLLGEEIARHNNKSMQKRAALDGDVSFEIEDALRRIAGADNFSAKKLVLADVVAQQVIQALERVRNEVRNKAPYIRPTDDRELAKDVWDQARSGFINAINIEASRWEKHDKPKAR